MCDHANSYEASRCACTGYGMGDPQCRCRRGRSLHAGETGACSDPAARCHEFVLTLPDAFTITEEHIHAAVLAIAREGGVPDDRAARIARAALTAGRETAIGRDRELERVRRERDALRSQVVSLVKERERGYRGHVGVDQVHGSAPEPGGDVQPVPPPGIGAGDLGVAGRSTRGMAVSGLRRAVARRLARTVPPPPA